MRFTVAVLPGDGIGPEIMVEAVKVIEAVGKRFGHTFDLHYGLIGGAAIDVTGSAMPAETINLCKGTDAILFAAVGGPKWDGTRVKARPEEGILGLRKEFKLFANLRPVKVYSCLADSSPVKPEIIKGTDLIIVRELTGGLYFSKPKKRWETSRGQRGIDTLLYTEQEIERIVRVAFKLAQERRKLVTSVDKANVLESSRLWREVAIRVSTEYPDIKLEHLYVDNAAMQLIKCPSRFDVVVMENTFGDILSDEASVLAGSMGLLPSASLAGLPASTGKLRRSISLYEPIHGSAPDIAGQGIANPIGMVLSAALMLRHSFRLHQEAAAIEGAVEQVLNEGYRTADITGDRSKAIKTTDMGDLIASRV